MKKGRTVALRESVKSCDAGTRKEAAMVTSKEEFTLVWKEVTKLQCVQMWGRAGMPEADRKL